MAPKLYQENYNKNFIEIEDFGNDTIFKILNKKKKNKSKKSKTNIENNKFLKIVSRKNKSLIFI